MSYTFIGTTDDTTTCDCCGKANLKKTVVLKNGEGDVVFYGVNCAARALGQKRGAVSVQVDAVAYAQRLLAVYTPEQVATAVWNRFGFCTDVKAGAVKIGSFAEVRA